MEPITLRLEGDTLENIEEEAEESGLTRAEYLREVIGDRHVDDEILREYEQQLAEFEETLDEYEAKVDELETELDRVHNEKRMILEQREENTELVEYVERERSLAEKKAQAGIATRAKWWLVGMEGD